MFTGTMRENTGTNPVSIVGVFSCRSLARLPRAPCSVQLGSEGKRSIIPHSFSVVERAMLGWDPVSC